MYYPYRFVDRGIREVKFGALLDRLMEKTEPQWLATGALFTLLKIYVPVSDLATVGHYGGVEWDTTQPLPRPKLVRADDRSKDQTYYLSGVRESSLRKVWRSPRPPSGPDSIVTLGMVSPPTYPQIKSLRDGERLSVTDCQPGRKHGYMFRRRETPFQRIPV